MYKGVIKRLFATTRIVLRYQIFKPDVETLRTFSIDTKAIGEFAVLGKRVFIVIFLCHPKVDAKNRFLR